MVFFRYWWLLVANRILVALCTLLGLAASVLVTYTATPMYQSQSQIFVSTPATSIDISALATGSNFSQQRVKSYAQIITSPTTLAPVVKQLKLDMTPAQLAGKITASAPLDTVLITLTVTDSNAQRAADIANAVASQFGTVVGSLEISDVNTQSPVKISVVKEALPAKSQSSPKVFVNLALGLLLGFGLGIGLASLRRLLDNTVKNEEDLNGVPLLAAIGFDKTADEKPLITDIGRYAARAEAFRTLRTNLKFVRPDSPPQVIMVGSALPVEGKTTSAINLAISMMHNGSKTLIIEADLRRPEVPKYLGIEKSKDKMGLSELLIEGKEFTPELLQSAISQHLDGDLDFMLSGKVPPNPAELLGSRVFDELLVALRKSYDFIIIDAPPLLPVTDGAIISTRCDGVILIVHAGTTKKPQLHGAVDALNSVGSPLLGAVLNQIPESSLEYEYGYRYGYPRYYGNNYGYSPGSEKPEANLYSPGPEDMARIEREDQRKRSTGQRFKEELQRQGEGKNQ